MEKFKKYHTELGFDYKLFKEDIGKISDINKDYAKSLLADLYNDDTYKQSKNHRLNISHKTTEKFKDCAIELKKGNITPKQRNITREILEIAYEISALGNFESYKYFKEELLPYAGKEGINISEYDIFLSEHDSKYDIYIVKKCKDWLNNFDKVRDIERECGKQKPSIDDIEMLTKSLKEFKKCGGDIETINLYKEKYSIIEEI